MAVAYHGDGRRWLMVAGRDPVGDLRLRSSLRLRRHLPFTRSWVTTGHRQDLCPPLIAAGISLEFVSRYLCGRRPGPYAVDGWCFCNALIISTFWISNPLTTYPRAEAVNFVIKGISYHENVLIGTKALYQCVLFRLNVLFRTKLHLRCGGCAA